jgi:hypothetical protein
MSQNLRAGDLVWPDLAIVRGTPATVLAMNDEIVMIRASRPGYFGPARNRRSLSVFILKLIVTA